MKKYDLPCYDTHKSFYGKAHVLEDENKRFLQSYDTVVCSLEYTEKGVYFVQLWGGYSATTMRHINSFLKHFHFGNYGGKKWWDKLPFGEAVKLV